VDTEDKRKIGEQLEPGGRAKAPGRLELLQRFVNTWNHELPVAWDRIGTASRAQSWLREKGLIDLRDRITADDAAELRALREALRTIIGTDRREVPDPEAIDTLRAAASTATLSIDIDESAHTSLSAGGSSAARAVATLLGIMHAAQLTGGWTRLTACRQCEYVFYDRSRNRSAVWCSMSICGNRSKNRAYYRRRQSAG
jgi:predicted RNA-binding Zn ribbon-like protein